MGGFDLYRAPWNGSACGPAEPVPDGVNTAADELDPAAWGRPEAGGVLYFASNRRDGGRGDFDLYAARADASSGALAVEGLALLNTRGDEREPAPTADGRTLFFASDRGRPGDFDLWKSFRNADAWLPPRPVQGLNSPAVERGPWPSQDGFALYFERRDGSRPGDLFRARSVELFRLPRAPVGWLDVVLFAALLLLALLAWLAKRWEQLDVIYKCFLVSVLLHLLLMWLLRGVHPESELAPAGRDRGRAFEVHLLRDRARASGLRERDGAAAVARAAREELAPPERLPGEPRPAERPAPGELNLARADAEPVRAPGPTPAPVAPSAERRAHAAARLADAEPAAARRTGGAPELAFSAAEVAPARTAIDAATPTRAAGAAPAPAPALPAAPVALARPTAHSDRPLPFRPSAGDLVPPGELAAASPQPDLAQPVEANPLRTGAAPPSELPGAVAFAATARASTGAPVPSPQPPRAGAGAPLPSEDAPRPELAGALARREEPGPAAPTRRPPAELEPAAAGAAPRGPRLETPVEDAAPRGKGAAAVELALPAAESFAEHRPASHDVREFAAPPRNAFAAAAEPPPEPAAPPSSAPLEVARSERARELPPSPERLQSTPYRSRFGSSKQVALETFGGGEDTERAVHDGLAYLAAHQRRGGYWAEAGDRDAKYHDVRVGNTALCLLAFLAAGHTQQSGTEHSAAVARAVDYLLATQDRRTGHFGDTASYGHGIATYALAECFAITGDPRLREPLERAVARVLANQVPEDYRGDPRLVGGWGYYYGDGSTYDPWPRVSITSWQVMALESARLGGLAVDEQALRSAGKFIARSWDPRLGALRYSHDPRRVDSEYPTLPGSTPAGLFALSLLGEDLGSERFAAPRNYVMSRLPRGWRYAGEQAFVERAQGNVYFLYYGSLAMLRAGGDDWRRWNVALKETLLPAQELDGSWRPLDVYARYAGDSREDSIYTTAMCVLTLEVYYRYFTPLLEKE